MFIMEKLYIEKHTVEITMDTNKRQKYILENKMDKQLKKKNTIKLKLSNSDEEELI